MGVRRNLIVLPCLAVLVATAGKTHADMLIEYSEDGSDLLLEFSGSFDFDATSSFTTSSPLGAIGNQFAPINRPIFYSTPDGYGDWQNFNSDFGLTTNIYSVLSATANTFWSVPYDTSATAFGGSFLFRYNYDESIPTVALWGQEDYTSGTQLSGSLRASGYSIASSGISDWSISFLSPTGSTETITIQAKSLNVVPEPSSLALFGIGAIGMVAMGRRRKKKQ